MDWISKFQGLASLEAPIRQRLIDESKIIAIPRQTVIFGPGKAPEFLILLLEGTVRVQQTAGNGREIVLYRVTAGESCVLTTACLLAYEDYQAEGVTETDVEAVAIPRGVFDRLVAESEIFRRFVFSAFTRRIADLFVAIEEIAFRRMDIRLAEKLLELPAKDGTIRITHQKLASELGTAREVVSRQLQEFQRRGWLEIARGEIRMTDPAALATYRQAS